MFHLPEILIFTLLPIQIRDSSLRVYVFQMCLQRKICKDRLPCFIKYSLAPPSLLPEGDLPKGEGKFNKPLWPNPLLKIHFGHRVSH